MKQAERIFMISDAAKQVEVEAHVLRYWEDELKLPVKRNEMGHRYYTAEDIKLFRRIKAWKEQGLQLKAIRNMLKAGTLKEPLMMFGVDGQEAAEKAGREETYIEEQGTPDLTGRHVIMVKKGEVIQSNMTSLQEETREQKSFRLQQLLSEMIARAVQSNNQELCQEIKESLLKELDYQFRLQEEKDEEREEKRVNRQEEHYRQIDELLRTYKTRGKDTGKEEKKKLKAEKKMQKDIDEKQRKEIEITVEEDTQEKRQGIWRRKVSQDEKPKYFLKRKRSIV
jgi:DNA-binding transcriptional MerR regulator